MHNAHTSVTIQFTSYDCHKKCQTSSMLFISRSLQRYIPPFSFQWRLKNTSILLFGSAQYNLVICFFGSQIFERSHSYHLDLQMKNTLSLMCLSARSNNTLPFPEQYLFICLSQNEHNEILISNIKNETILLSDASSPSALFLCHSFRSICALFHQAPRPSNAPNLLALFQYHFSCLLACFAS